VVKFVSKLVDGGNNLEIDKRNWSLAER